MKLGWIGAGALVVGTLMVANGSSPGTSEKTGQNASETVAAVAPPVYSAASGALQIVGGLAQQALSALSQTVQQMPQQPQTPDTLPPAQRP
jgi:hypothetical protein